MSDHLCEVNDKLLKQTDELEALRKSKVMQGMNRQQQAVTRPYLALLPNSFPHAQY